MTAVHRHEPESRYETITHPWSARARAATRRSNITPRVAKAGLLALLLLAALTNQAVARQPAASLAGEAVGGSELPGVGTSAVTGTCNPDGLSRFRFVVTGEASGPYPGTFEESGTFTLGPRQPAPDNPTGDPGGNHHFPPLKFRSAFTIFSGPKVVTGHRTLSDVPPPTPDDPFFNFGACGQGLSQPGIPVPTNAISLQIRTDYRAHIRTPTGNHLARGSSLVDYGDLGVRGIPFFQSWRFLASFE
jgi:hypothetical protein